MLHFTRRYFVIASFLLLINTCLILFISHELNENAFKANKRNIHDFADEGFVILNDYEKKINFEENKNLKLIPAKGINSLFFYIVNTMDYIEYQFPSIYQVESSLEELHDVIVTDINEDGKDDIIVIADFYPRYDVSPTAKAFPIATIFIQIEDGFTELNLLGEKMNTDLEDKSSEVVLAYINDQQKMIDWEVKNPDAEELPNSF